MNILLLAAFTLGCSAVLAQEPDNSKMNKQPSTTTDQAKNNKGDVKMMQQIRKAIVKDKSLSTYAHNAKVVASNGKVTVSGPVKSEDEKKALIQKATDIAGAGNVTDELTVDVDKH
jgi:BON domain/Heat induced stress protein YflT domain